MHISEEKKKDKNNKSNYIINIASSQYNCKIEKHHSMEVLRIMLRNDTVTIRKS